MSDRVCRETHLRNAGKQDLPKNATQATGTEVCGFDLSSEADPLILGDP